MTCMYPRRLSERERDVLDRLFAENSTDATSSPHNSTRRT